MATVTYKPGPGENEETSQFGYDFKGKKSVEVTNPDHLAKFRGNRFFEVSESKAEAKKAAETAPKPASGTTSELSAVHRGRGSWSIMQGAEEVRDGLSKEDADAFNAMSAEDKAEYVK
jgi:hypothetical protein